MPTLVLGNELQQNLTGFEELTIKNPKEAISLRRASVLVDIKNIV